MHATRLTMPFRRVSRHFRQRMPYLLLLASVLPIAGCGGVPKTEIQYQVVPCPSSLPPWGCAECTNPRSIDTPVPLQVEAEKCYAASQCALRYRDQVETRVAKCAASE